jgi:hypothetical protein
LRISFLGLLLAGVACAHEPDTGAVDSGLRTSSDAPSPKRDRVGCFSYRDTVAIRGVLRREIHPGRPNYESVASGDEAETGFYLHLPVPACTRDGTDDWMEARLDTVNRVQLVLDSVGYAALRPYLEDTVAVRGTIFSSHTGHHHAPLLLTPVGAVRRQPNER